jgi:hypothetical protein
MYKFQKEPTSRLKENPCAGCQLAPAVKPMGNNHECSSCIHNSNVSQLEFPDNGNVNSIVSILDQEG